MTQPSILDKKDVLEQKISYFKMKDEEFICFSKEQRNKINQLKKSILEKIGWKAGEYSSGNTIYGNEWTSALRAEAGLFCMFVLDFLFCIITWTAPPAAYIWPSP